MNALYFALAGFSLGVGIGNRNNPALCAMGFASAGFIIGLAFP